MTPFEKSECFRAFLLLVAQDGKISPEERTLLLFIGRKLDFEIRFCETAISDILENRYINKEPPVFSKKEFAESFLRDALRIAQSDKEIHPTELLWIVSIADRNGLTNDWIEITRAEEAGRNGSKLRQEKLAIEEHI